MNRRKFLKISALFCAPAIVKAENIMPVSVPAGYQRNDSGLLLIKNKDYITIRRPDIRFIEENKRVFIPGRYFTIEGVMDPHNPELLKVFQGHILND